LTQHLPGWLRVVLAMVGWALVAVSFTGGLWLGVTVAVLLCVFWLYRIRVTAHPGETWVDTVLWALTWAIWGLVAWIALSLAAVVVLFGGAAVGLWGIEDL
jgi:hypothetical protein